VDTFLKRRRSACFWKVEGLVGIFSLKCGIHLQGSTVPQQRKTLKEAARSFLD